MKQGLLRASITEMIGTFLLVFFGCGAVVINEAAHGVLGHLGISLTFGLVVMTVVFAIGHVSGGHINPAVTIAFACAGKFPWNKSLAYIISQFLGAILAAFCLKCSLASGQTLGVTLPTGSLYQAFLLEMIMTAFLMFVAMSVATDARASSMLAAVAIGSAVAIDALMGGPVTGASMNPARSFGPALIAGQLEHIWLYIAAPILGALVGGFSYLWCASTK